MFTDIREKPNESRLDWLDAAKGIAILLVVIGHCFRDGMLRASPACNLIYQFVYCVHMPVFFCVSGYLYARKRDAYLKEPLLPLLGRRAKALILPFITVSLLIYAVYFVAARIPMLKGVLDSPVPFSSYVVSLLAGNNPYAFHLWYIYALSILFMLTHLLFKAFERFRYGEYVLLALAFFGWLRWAVAGDLSITILNAVTKYWIYYMAGFFLFRLKKTPSKPFLLAASVPAIAYLVYFALNRDGSASAWRPYSYACLLLSVLVFVLDVFAVSRSASGWAGRLLMYLGRKSYTIYLLHQPFFCAFVGTVLYGKMGLPILPVVVLCFAMSIAAPLLIARALSLVKPVARVTKTFLNVP